MHYIPDDPTPVLATENLFRFGAKEWSKIFSDYDFGARYYSTAHHRFSTMDPMAEKYYHLSPYAYCGGNPVRFVDPTGLSQTDYYTLLGIVIHMDDGRDDAYLVLTENRNVDIIMEHIEKKNYTILPSE